MTENKNYKLKDGPESAGVITFTSYLLDSDRAIEIDKFLNSAVLIPSELYKNLISELDSICPKKRQVKCNLCVKAGRSLLAGILNGETSYTGIINYGCLGTSSTAVADTDTQLGAEVKRKAVGTRTRVDDQVNFDFYFSKSDVSGTFEEFGMVIDGTATENTGVLFNRLLTGGWTKSPSEALTASVQVNINHA